MDAYQIKLDIIDNMTATLQNIRKLSGSTFEKMSSEQKQYQKAVDNSREAVLQLQKQLLTKTGQEKKNLQEEIKLQRQLTTLMKERANEANKIAKQSSMEIAKQQRQQARESQQRSTNVSNFAGGALSSMGGGIGMFASGNPYMIAGQIMGKGVSEAIEFGKAIYETRSEFEKLQSTLSVSVGKENAASYFAEIKKVAQETPFEVKDLTELFVTLSNKINNLKFDKTQMVNLADLASAVGKPMEFLTGAIGDATDTARWKNLGISIKKHGDLMDATFKGKTIKNIEQTAEGALKMAAAFGQMNGVAGISATVMDTMAGKASNISDGFTNLEDNLGKRFETTIKGAQNSIIELFSYFNKLTEIPLSETISKERTEVNMLVGVATDLNNAEKVRKDALTELINKYPTYFSNLDTEKSKIEDVTSALDKYNQARGKSTELQIAKESKESMQTELNMTNQNVANLSKMRELLKNGLKGDEAKLYEEYRSKLPFEMKKQITPGKEGLYSTPFLEASYKKQLSIQKSQESSLSSRTSIEKMLSFPSLQKEMETKIDIARKTEKSKLTPGQKQALDFYNKIGDNKNKQENIEKVLELFKNVSNPNENPKTPKVDKSNSAANLAIANIKADNEKLKREREIEQRVSNDLTTSKNIHQISLTVQQAIGQKIDTQNINNAKDFNQEDILRSMMIVFQKQLDDVMNNFKNKNKI